MGERATGTMTGPDARKRRARRVGRGRRAVAAGLILATLAVVATACPPPPPPPAQPQNPLSLGTGGVPGNGAATAASINSTGTVVAFTSEASNLVPNDTNGVSDLFVRVVPTGAVTRIAQQVGGEPRVSPNGRYVAYRANGGQLTVFDRTANTSTSWTPTVTGFAPVTPVVTDDGAVAISGVYSSFGITGTDCRVRTLSTGAEQTCPPGGPGFGQVAYEAASPNGRFVLYSWIDQSGGGTSGRLLWDRTAGTTAPVPSAVASFPTFMIVGDDGTIAFTQVLPSGLGGIATYDPTTATVTTMIGPVPDNTSVPTGIAADGSTVTFASQATNLVAADTNGVADTFRWDVATGTVVRTSVALATAAQLPNGATRCGSAPGQVTTTGLATCGLTVDPAATIDTNGLGDAYRFG